MAKQTHKEIRTSAQWERPVKCQACKLELKATVNNIKPVSLKENLASMTCPCGEEITVMHVPNHILKQLTTDKP